MRSWFWFATRLIGLLALVAAVVYWAKFAPVRVVAVSVQQADIVEEVMGTGTLEARVSTQISPKISGRIVEVMVDQGEHVRSGDLLLRLDDDELKQQVEIAKAHRGAKRAAIERLQSDRRRTEAILAQARNDFERLSRLAASNAASASDLDKARESLAVAEAGLAHSEASMTEAQEDLVAAERSLDYQQSLLANAEVHAPFDGLIVARTREQGDVVVPGSSILTLISTDELWINAWVDETEMAKLSAGQPARVLFRSESENVYGGKVARLGKQTDRETREFVVDVRVLELPENWAVGQRGDVYIEVSRKKAALAVPIRAIQWRTREDHADASRQAGVFVNVGGTAHWRPVQLGLRSRELAEITKGLRDQRFRHPARPGAAASKYWY